MVKPVFQVINDIHALIEEQSPAAADAARTITMNFLTSAAAEKVNRGQAGTFLPKLKSAFDQLKSPQHYGTILDAIEAGKTNVGLDFQQMASFARIDFTSEAKYLKDMPPAVIRNARILSGLETEKKSSEGFDFAAPSFQHSANPEYFEIRRAQNYGHLKLAINQILNEQDITDNKAAAFFKTVVKRCTDLNISTKEQIELMTLIQDGTSKKDKIFDLAVVRANGLLRKEEKVLEVKASAGAPVMENL